jgi:predicted DsbA family dithiol-disulfide isomerase
MALESPHITAIAIEATEFPDLVQRYRITGVPKTVVDDQIEILGALPEPQFIQEALGALQADDHRQ